jgi:hypothetical protein
MNYEDSFVSEFELKGKVEENLKAYEFEFAGCLT